MKAQQSAYATGFDAGLKGATVDATPYRGHTAGYHRGLANQWKRGCENGDMAASMLKSVSAKRDEATDLDIKVDSAIANEDYNAAAELLQKQADALKRATLDMQYYVRLMDTRANPEKHGY